MCKIMKLCTTDREIFFWTPALKRYTILKLWKKHNRIFFLSILSDDSKGEGYISENLNFTDVPVIFEYITIIIIKSQFNVKRDIHIKGKN